MPATYTPLLRLTKPGLGDTGWGTTANDGITELVDTSVAGTVSVDVTSGNVTLSTANGATDQARHMFIRVFGASVARDVLVPATSKLYFVVNDCTAAVTVKVSGQTGVAIPAGTTAVVRCNGTDVVTSLSYAPALTLGAALAAASGGTGQASYTTGDLLYATGATALSKLGIGTNGQILTSTGTAPQWSTLSGVAVTTFSAGTTGFTPNSATSGAVTLAGTLATTNGGTGLTSFTANGVVYASSTSALATGSALTFDGTKALTVGTGTATQRASITLDGGANAGIGAFYGINVGGSTVGVVSSSGYAASDTSTDLAVYGDTGKAVRFYANGSEQMRLTSTGLGIGTSSPGTKLDVAGTIRSVGSTGASSPRINLLSSGFWTWGIYGDGNTFKIQNDATDRFFLDSSGNLGLGVTPSAWWSAMKPLQMSGNGFIGSASNYTYVGANFFYNSSANPVYVASAAASLYEQGAGGHRWYTAPSGTAGNAISFAQAMTLSGTATPSLRVGVTADLAGFNFQAANQVGFSVHNSGSSATAAYFSAANNVSLSSAGNFAVINGTDGILFGSAATERARITSGGNFGIGTQSPQKKLHVYDNTQAVGNASMILEGYIGGYGAGVSFQSVLGGSSTLAEMARITADGEGPWQAADAGTQDAGLRFYTALNGTVAEKMRLNNSGNLTVGYATDRGFRASIYASANATSNISALNLENGLDGGVELRFTNSVTTSQGLASITAVVDGAGAGTDEGNLVFKTANSAVNTERARITSGGNVLIGSDTSTSTAGWGAGALQVSSSTYAVAQIYTHNASVGNTSALELARSRGSKTSPTIVGNGDDLGVVNFVGYDGANYRTAAAIYGFVDGNTGASDMPGRIEFRTTPDGSSSPTERARITSGGDLLVGTTSGSGDRVYVSGYVRASSGFKTDGTTWIDSPSSETMRFVTNNTERARITSGGNFVLGNGETAASPTGSTLQATGGSGTNITGATLTIQGGRGTGSAEGGPIVFSTSAAGSSGTTLNTADERARISPAGNLLVGVQSDAYKITAWSSSGDNGLCIQNATTGIGSGNGFLVGLTSATDAALWSFESNALIFATNNTERARITSTGNVVAGGSVALATNATDGFLYVPTCAGTPTGTPTAITGMAPIVVNTTNNKLYFYSGGQWRDAGP